MLSYETHFKSDRKDGRFYSSWAAHMEMVRNTKPRLTLPENLTKEIYLKWQQDVKDKLRELLRMPEFTKQPAPKKLGSVKRDTYTVEKWEFYPDDYTAVPFLILIPDCATKENPAPGVMCFPGSTHSKEFFSDEPLLENPMCHFTTYPERNRMARYMAENGMVAFVFDNLETAETGLHMDSAYGRSRVQVCHGYLQTGHTYPGIAVFQKLCVLEFIKSLDYVDNDRLALCGHSLGSETALYLSLMCDDFKALIYNEMVQSERYYYMSVTEQDDSVKIAQNIGEWHTIPGIFNWFSLPDLCAAIAPKYIALDEGGCELWLDKIRNVYKLFDAEDKMSVSYYPAYADAKKRTYLKEHPKYGLSVDDYFRIQNADTPDHSFRKDPAIKVLKECFKL